MSESRLHFCHCVASTISLPRIAHCTDEELAKVREQARALKLDAAATAATNKKDKPVYLKDLHREAVLSGKLLGDDDGEDDTRRPQPTHQEEQEQLKRELKVELWRVPFFLNCTLHTPACLHATERARRGHECRG